MMNIRTIVVGLVLSLAACHSGSAPEKKHKAASAGTQMAELKMPEVEAGIKAYITEKAKGADGYFQVKEQDLELRLKLLHVHTEYLHSLGAQGYFACVDLADVSGDVYDVDFFVKGEPGNMAVTGTTLHKRNGKPFYSWKQTRGKTWQKVPVEEASSDLLGVVEGQDKFEFHYQARLPHIAEAARMWVPIAKSDTFQTVNLVSIKAPGKQQLLVEKENNNSILYLELGPEHSGEMLEIIYDVERQEKGPFEEIEPVEEKYLSASKLMPVGGRFKEIATKAIGEKRKESKLVQARALYNYVIEQMRYIKTGDYGKGDAIYACDTRTGNCTEFHSFFISLARSAGIPARFSIGASIPSERNEGGIAGYHCWAEFYAEGKWWPVDLSEGNKHTALASYYFGRHPANRIELSRGRDLKPEPGPLSGPINFMVYPVLEIGGKPASTENSFSFIRKQD